jgi:hypothetical protein
VALGLGNLTDLLDPQMFITRWGPRGFRRPVPRSDQGWFTELLYAADLRPHPQVVFTYRQARRCRQRRLDEELR